MDIIARYEPVRCFGLVIYEKWWSELAYQLQKSSLPVLKSKVVIILHVSCSYFVFL